MTTLSPEAIKAIKYLIKQTPAGEMLEVVPHLVTLAGDSETLQQNPDVLAAMRKWFETHHHHINLGNDKIAMVTENGHAGEGPTDFLYYDSTNELTFKFDPFTQQGEVLSDEKMEIPTCDLREALMKDLKHYVDHAYRKGKA
jgi:hypothetical protein